MTSWVYLTYPPREQFAATMTEEERTVFSEHFAYLTRLLESEILVMAGPTLGDDNIGITVFDAPDRESAERIMAADPVVRSGIVRPELREMRVSLLRGREED